MDMTVHLLFLSYRKHTNRGDNTWNETEAYITSYPNVSWEG